LYPATHKVSGTTNPKRNEIGGILILEILKDPDTQRTLNTNASAHYGGTRLGIKMNNGIEARWSMRNGTITFEGLL